MVLVRAEEEECVLTFLDSAVVLLWSLRLGSDSAAVLFWSLRLGSESRLLITDDSTLVSILLKT